MGWVVIISLALAAVLFFRDREKKRRRLAAEPVIAAALATHSRALYIQAEQMKKTDPYGNVDNSKFFDEHIPYFILNVIVRDLLANGLDTDMFKEQRYVKELSQRICRAADMEAAKESEGNDLTSVKTGIDFEIFCKHRLEQAGWAVRTTPATGDQGADLIARKKEKVVVLQCKYYGQPVGNKAVQEAYAAKGFHRADFAVVVTNSTFTPSAQQIAATNKVLLIHHLTLSELEHAVVI